jgi:hypothetical protein
MTRDERFFCQRLYTFANQDTRKFVRTLNALSDGIALDESVDWEVGYEVCFFRDLRHHRKGRWPEGAYYSPKRTFDLCLFSERRILIIEAKAQQSFDADAAQWDNFEKEPEYVRQALGRADVDVSMLMIASKRYIGGTKKRFTFPPVTWAALSEAYGGDTVLARADEVFEKSSSGVNNEGHRTGQELLDAWLSGERLFVGRQGGLSGALLQQDILSGAWRERLYETRDAKGGMPNGNWFLLEQFLNLVEAPGAAAEA